jgi:hypothetical protein
VSNLTARDLEVFAKFRIPPELLGRAGIVRVTDREAREDYGIRGGGDMAGVAFPYFAPETLTNGRRRNYVRIRRDFPEIEDGRPKKKYVAPYGDRKHLYFPPTPELFADVSVPLVLVEAEKSALALTAWAARVGRRILPLAMGGCYGWMGKVGTKQTATGERVAENGAIPDLGICRDGRQTYVLLDANCRMNPKVQRARAGLVRQLRKLRAAVAILDLPSGDGVNGPDDFIGIMGDEATTALFEGAGEGGEILDDVQAFISRFVLMSPSQLDAVALWILHTYSFRSAIWTPYLAVTSAAMRCGKSRLLETVSFLVHKPWYTSSASAASLFRDIDKSQPTLLLDEVDALFKGDKEMAQAVRAVLNAGAHHKGVVSRVVGKGSEMTTKNFSAYCPKALAGIGNLPSTVADRSLHIRLERKMSGEKVERLRERTIEPQAAPLRLRMSEWTEKHTDRIRNIEPDLPMELNDRQQDGAEILVGIADIAGGRWPEKSRKALIELSTGAVAEDQSIGTQLLRDIRVIFEEAGDDKIRSTDLVDKLAKIETSPWPEWKNQKPITPNQLARLLKEFKISPKPIRFAGDPAKGYERASFAHAWERYSPETPLPDESSGYTVTNQYPCGETDFSSGYGNCPVTVRKTKESPVFIGIVTAATAQKRGDGHREDKEAPLLLVCPVHGRHSNWWVQILSEGGEMTCGECSAEPNAEGAASALENSGTTSPVGNEYGGTANPPQQK